MGKQWYKSKTVWAGILEFAAGFLLVLAGELNAGASLSLVGVVTIFLRLITKEEVLKP